MGCSLALAPGEVHLWLTFTDEVQDPALLAAYLRLLAPEEEAQRQRFAFERLRHEYLVARALVRTTLSRYAAVDPGRWVFQAGAHGRPEIQGPAAPRLRFNLSHTRGLMAVGVTLELDVGVDVENKTRKVRGAEIADRFFSPAEVRGLRALPPGRQKDRFFHLWSLKEAYIKGRGLGLALPLDSFTYELDEGQNLALSVSPPNTDDPAAWQVALLAPTPEHAGAVAVRGADRPLLPLRCRRVVPLAEDRELEVPVLCHTASPRQEQRPARSRSRA